MSFYGTNIYNEYTVTSAVVDNPNPSVPAPAHIIKHTISVEGGASKVAEINSYVPKYLITFDATQEQFCIYETLVDKSDPTKVTYKPIGQISNFGITSTDVQDKTLFLPDFSIVEGSN